MIQSVNSEHHEIDPARILVVDDSIFMRTLLQETLLASGLHVILAADGLEAWELLQKEVIHLIVADVNTPRLDGLELTRMIRANQRFAALPIILLSATDAGEDRRLGLAYGANAFLTKEMQDLEWLGSRIIRMLERGTNA
jgi:CheY-like chemotaxis protein